MAWVAIMISTLTWPVSGCNRSTCTLEESRQTTERLKRLLVCHISSQTSTELLPHTHTHRHAQARACFIPHYRSTPHSSFKRRMQRQHEQSDIVCMGVHKFYVCGHAWSKKPCLVTPSLCACACVRACGCARVSCVSACRCAGCVQMSAASESRSVLLHCSVSSLAVPMETSSSVYY